MILTMLRTKGESKTYGTTIIIIMVMFQGTSCHPADFVVFVYVVLPKAVHPLYDPGGAEDEHKVVTESEN